MYFRIYSAVYSSKKGKKFDCTIRDEHTVNSRSKSIGPFRPREFLEKFTKIILQLRRYRTEDSFLTHPPFHWNRKPDREY